MNIYLRWALVVGSFVLAWFLTFGALMALVGAVVGGTSISIGLMGILAVVGAGAAVPVGRVAHDWLI